MDAGAGSYGCPGEGTAQAARRAGRRGSSGSPRSRSIEPNFPLQSTRKPRVLEEAQELGSLSPTWTEVQAFDCHLAQFERLSLPLCLSSNLKYKCRKRSIGAVGLAQHANLLPGVPMLSESQRLHFQSISLLVA